MNVIMSGSTSICRKTNHQEHFHPQPLQHRFHLYCQADRTASPANSSSTDGCLYQYRLARSNTILHLDYYCTYAYFERHSLWLRTNSAHTTTGVKHFNSTLLQVTKVCSPSTSVCSVPFCSHELLLLGLRRTSPPALHLTRWASCELPHLYAPILSPIHRPFLFNIVRTRFHFLSNLLCHSIKYTPFFFNF